MRSRFEGGLITDIQPPDFETRTAILRKKTLSEGYVVPNDVLLFIAEKAAVGAAGFGTCLINMILPEVFATILAVIPLFLIYRWLARKVQATQLEEEESPWLR